jgi:hypothetical protein
VLLFGTVDTLREREEIERMIARIPGVVGVVNDLAVRTPTSDADGPHRMTEAARLRRVSRKLRGLDIPGDDGSVALSA